jgi:flagellar assembly protein FliH
MEMILRAPKLSDERRMLPVARPVPEAGPAAEPGAGDAGEPAQQADGIASCDTVLPETSTAPDVQQLAREAAEVLAREQAAREAERERQRRAEEELARDEARRLAREEGLQQGRAEGRMEMQSAIESLRAIAASLEAARDAWLADREDDLVCLVYEAVCRICGPLLATREGVREHLSATLQQVRGREPVTVRLASADIGKLREIGADTWEGRQVALVADSSLDAGGCVIETAAGTLDARLSWQLEHLLDVLRSARRPCKEQA